MKKMKFLVLTVMSFVAISLTVTPTYAWSSDLYDDATENSNGGTTIELLENSIYEINIVSKSGAPDNDYFGQDLSQDTFYVDISDYDGLIGAGIGGTGMYWSNDYTNQSWTIDTDSDGTTIDIELSTTGTAQLYDAFAGNYDIQVFWLGNTEPVDNVAPEYTYSQASVDTPYYDLVTVSEIQSQLQAVDPEDGDVTSRIQVYEDYYTSVTPKNVGDEFFVVFMVDDIAGNSAYLRVDINVIDDRKPMLVVTNLQDQTGEEFDGTSISLNWFDDNYNNELDSYIDQLAYNDDYYGYVDFESSTATSAGWSFSRTGDWGTYDPQVPGTYTLNASAMDPSGNTSTISFNVTVQDNAAPVINGSETLDFEAVGFSTNEILSHYSATDKEDGTVAVTIKTHNITGNVLGSYSVTLSAIDSFGKEQTKTVTINLVDTTLPVFKIDDIPTTNYSHTVYMSDTSTLQALIDGIVVTDAHDGAITNSLVVPALPSYAVPGTHNLAITATDSSGNIGTLNITVTVADDILPVINGATKIVKGKTEILTLSDILATLTATDNVDGSLSLELVQDGYSGNSAVIGSYLVKYKTTDTSGNIKYHDVRVWIVDNSAPAWIVNDYFVNLGINEVMTRTELVSLLQASGMIGSDISYTVTFVNDEYTGNEEIEGAYNVVMNVTYEDGSESQLQVQLNVPEVEDDGDVIVVDPEPTITGFQKFLNNTIDFVKNIWNSIKSAGLWVWDKLVWVYDHVIVPVYEFIFVKHTTGPIPTVTTETPSTTVTTTQSSASELPLTSTSSPIQNL